MQPIGARLGNRESGFQSSPVPEDGCNSPNMGSYPVVAGFNPHPSRRTGATMSNSELDIALRVSILTRPGGRVQLGVGADGEPVFEVSILTRPGGRVQLRSLPTTSPSVGFQSSPVPEDGCNPLQQRRLLPSPLVSILTRPGGRVQLTVVARECGYILQFQSSPVPEDGCNGSADVHVSPAPVFQSSPVPEDGCNGAPAGT